MTVAQDQPDLPEEVEFPVVEVEKPDKEYITWEKCDVECPAEAQTIYSHIETGTDLVFCNHHAFRYDEYLYDQGFIELEPEKSIDSDTETVVE